jgi:hypothetical protein
MWIYRREGHSGYLFIVSHSLSLFFMVNISVVFDYLLTNLCHFEPIICSQKIL